MKRAGLLLGAAGAYVAVGVVAWWHVLAGGISHTLSALGWGDPAQQVWFIGWVPHALDNGLDPFVSHAMFAPHGINLMANSSILFPALVASPVTELFGPVVAYNLCLIVVPAVSAFVSYLVFRRYTDFSFGAWLGGLFYGFSPFVLNDLGDGHLHVTLLVFPPLVWLLLDDLAVRRRGSPVSRGVLLGLVVAAQALTSLEVLLIITLVGAAGLVLLGLSHPRAVGERLGRVAIGLATTAVTAGVLLAWPVYILAAGPQRYHGSIFTSPESYVAWLKALVWPRGGQGALPATWPAYVGIPLLVIVAAGFVVSLRQWDERRQRPGGEESGSPPARTGVIPLATALAIVGAIFATGRTLHVTPKLSTGIPMPDRVVSKLPLVQNLLPVRFMIAVDFCLALAFAVTLGMARETVVRWRPSPGPAHSRRRPAVQPATRGETPSRRLAASLTAGCVGIAALVSPALGAGWPYPARQVSVPAVYRSRVLTRVSEGSVLLAYPVMNGFEADPMIWQASEGFPYDTVAGYGFVPGPGPHPLGSLGSGPVTELFADAEVGLLPPTISASRADAVAAQIRSWQVSDLVMLPTGKGLADLVSVMTTLLHRRPDKIGGAFVWTGLRGVRLGPMRR